MSIDLDFFGLTEEVARPIAHSLSTNRRGCDCWGWPRLVRVSVSSTNTCPRYHQEYALAEGMERGVMGDKGWCGIRGVGL